MRIAVLFYGRLRKFKEHRENFLDSIGRENTLDIFYSADAEPHSQLEEFLDLYNPVRWCNDAIENTIEHQLYKYKNPPSPDHYEFTHVRNMTKHFYNKKRVVGLLDDYIRETGTTYDVVLFLRFDLFYKEPFVFQEVQENTVYIPEGHNYALLAVNDQLAYGSFETMKKYMTLYDNVVSFLDQDAFLHPESLHYWNLRHHGIQVVRYPFAYNIYLSNGIVR